MKNALCALFFCSSFALSQGSKQASPPKPSVSFELKGDSLGETLETFKLHNPNAQCEKDSPRLDTCMMWVGVTIADAPAVADPDCTLHSKTGYSDCMEGMYAHFTEQKLDTLSYTVGGTYFEQIASALRKKYGPSSLDSKEGALWSDVVSTLSVGVAHGAKKDHTIVMLFLKDTGAEKDI